MVKTELYVLIHRTVDLNLPYLLFKALSLSTSPPQDTI